MSTTTFDRRLGLPAVIGLSTAAMLGAGLFVLPGVAVARAGSSAWLAYVVAGLGVLPAALCKSELATAMPVAGGTYVYMDRTLGPWVSTIGGLGLWAALLLKSAFALVGFGAYLRVMTDLPVSWVGLALLLVIVALNVLGIGKVARVQMAVVVVSLAGLLGLVALGLPRVDLRRLAAPFEDGAGGFFVTVSLVYMSYAGVTKVAAIAEEVRDPGRTLPRGMLISLASVTLLYGLVTAALIATVPRETLAGDVRPLHSMGLLVGGPTVGLAVAALGVLTLTSMANTGLLAASRFPFAMSRDRLLPSFLGYVNERFKTPVVSILATGALMAFAIVALDVESIAKLTSSLMIVGFMFVNLAVIVLREAGAQWYKPAYRVPLYPLVPILGLGVGAVLLVLLGAAGLGALLVVLAVGTAVFLLFGAKRTDRRGVLGLLGRRPDALGPEGPAAPDSKGAGVLVPLVGREHSPETLVELACALAGDRGVSVVNLFEVPEQLTLDVVDEDEVTRVESLRRRIGTLTDALGRAITVDAVATRDVVRTIHALSRRPGTDWAVLEWRAKTARGVLSLAPMGWLIEHLGCNLALYRDSGVRRIRKILALVEPGPHDALAVTTADDLARTYRADLTLVRFSPDSGDAIERQACADYVDEMAALCRTEPERIALHGPEVVAAVAKLTAGYDLLVMGAPRDPGWRDYLLGTAAERLTRAAACSVLRLKTPRERTHEVVARTAERRAQPEPELADFLAESCLQAGLDLATKDALFAHFAGAFAQVLPAVDAGRIQSALWERERTQNTAIGDGMALPHATVAEADRAYLGVFTTAMPVDYKAPNGAAVDVFLVTLGPPSARNTHLRILAGLAQRVLRDGLLEDLRAASTPAELRAPFARRPGD